MPRKFDRTRNGPLFYLALAVLLYVLMSGAIAWATIDSCGGVEASKEWSYFPPRWECPGPRF